MGMCVSESTRRALAYGVLNYSPGYLLFTQHTQEARRGGGVVASVIECPVIGCLVVYLFHRYGHFCVCTGVLPGRDPCRYDRQADERKGLALRVGTRGRRGGDRAQTLMV